MYRSNFPYHPSQKEQYEPMGFADDGNTETAWIEVPSNLQLLYLQKLGGGGPFSAICTWSECLTVGSLVESLLQSSVIQAPDRLDREWVWDSLQYASPEESTLIMIKQQCRVLAIPHETCVKDLWRGAKWPNADELAFEDLQCRGQDRTKLMVSLSVGDMILTCMSY